MRTSSWTYASWEIYGIPGCPVEFLLHCKGLLRILRSILLPGDLWAAMDLEVCSRNHWEVPFDFDNVIPVECVGGIYVIHRVDDVWLSRFTGHGSLSRLIRILCRFYDRQNFQLIVPVKYQCIGENWMKKSHKLGLEFYRNKYRDKYGRCFVGYYLLVIVVTLFNKQSVIIS